MASLKKQLWNMQTDLIEEEAAEFLEAADEVFADPENDKRREEMLKELCDLVFVCYQFAAAFSLDLDEALRRVFESNMSKLDEHGKPIYREDGKVLKGPNYQPPSLLGFIHKPNTLTILMENNVIARQVASSLGLMTLLPDYQLVALFFVVEDSMEGPNGIEASWRFVSHALRFGAGVAVHLSKSAPARTDNGKGLVASGPVSFGKIYSCLNEQLRQRRCLQERRGCAAPRHRPWGYLGVRQLPTPRTPLG